MELGEEPSMRSIEIGDGECPLAAAAHRGMEVVRVIWRRYNSGKSKEEVGLNLGTEDEQTEFKRSTSELREGMESISSILNKHESGVLYFGIRNDGEIIGQDVSEKTLRQVSQSVSNSIRPVIHPEVEQQYDEDGHSFICVRFSGKDIPYSCNGRYRIRVADEDVPASPEELARMFDYARARKTPWDEWPSERPIDDIDEKELRDYVSRGNACGRIPFEFEGIKATLDRLELLTGGKLTNAAAVLFCPSRNIGLKEGILANRARTEILDLSQKQGTLFDLVHEGELYILNNTRRRFITSGDGPREEVPEIPTKAIREALMNAYAHRDWLSLDCIQINIFYDSVEIDSPGWFIEGQDPTGHLSGISRSSKTRNELLAKTLFRSKDIESYGTGIPRIKELCDDAGVGIEYMRTPTGTRLIFHRNDAFAGEPTSNPPATHRKIIASASITLYTWDYLDDREKKVFSFLEEHGESRAAAISNSTGIKRRTLSDVLARLSKKGIIIARGESRSRTYCLPQIQDGS